MSGRSDSEKAGPFYVLPWDGTQGGWYSKENAVKVYAREHAAEAYARKMGGNLVVRSAAYVR